MNETYGIDGLKAGHLHSQSERDASKPKVGSRSLLRILQRQEYRCALTGRELTPETAVADHIKPVVKGGSHTEENIQVVHASVNTAKATLPPDEFVQMCREVVAWTDKHGFKRGG